MKIDQTTFPIVFKVKSGNARGLLSAFIKCEVEYITMPFYDTLNRFRMDSPAFASKLTNAQGIILFSKSQYFYRVFDGDFTLLHYNQEYPLANISGKIPNDGSFEYREDGSFFNKELVSDKAELDSKYVEGIVEFLLRYLCFKQFGNVEVFVVSTNKGYGYKHKKIIDEEVYETESKFPVKIVDSKYIRTLIRSGQFRVRGHFRLQPSGIGKQNLRLIWVSEHVREKHNILRKSL